MNFQPSGPRFASMVTHRRHLHQQPEVGIELPDTHAYLRSQLEGLGLEVEGGPGRGVSVRIRGTGSDMGPIVFRADMDALPVVEETGETFSSQRPGAMHACGHDLHMATLLAVVEDLVESPPARDVIAAFQPGEESDRGALPLLEHRNLQVEGAETFAVHVNAVVPFGTFAYTRGTFMAHGDWFRLSIEGAGGHASAPERVGNPIRLGSQWTEAVVARAKELSTPTSRVVATVTEFLGGNTVNVIPTTTSLRGTIRTVTLEQRTELIADLRGYAEDLAADMGLVARFELREGYPAVVNDSAFVEGLVSGAQAAGVPGTWEEMDHPSMVIEDFSYFLHRWPGAMVYVGAAIRDNPSFNHSATARFSEDAMAHAFSLFRHLAPSAG